MPEHREGGGEVGFRIRLGDSGMTIVAILVGRLVAWLCRATGRGGTSLPGAVVLRFHPDLHAKLARQLPAGVVLITGTNGKTTTSKMLASILRSAGLRVVRNVSGANLRQGITSALIGASSPSGRIEADCALFEVDEGVAPREVEALRPRLLLVTNLFRDQLDRYGELATTARRLRESITAHLPDTSTLVLNADDPLVAGMAEHYLGKVRFFGLECPNRSLADADDASDSDECEACGHELAYDVRYGSHIGRWRCPGCGRTRPEPALSVRGAELTRGLEEALSIEEGQQEPLSLTLRLPGMYNVANAAAAACSALALGISREAVLTGLESTSPAFGRLERVTLPSGKTALLMLVKNPAGLNEVARLVSEAGGPRPAVVALNDNTADGHDVSWIWDADFERLRGVIGPVFASGVRAHDIALRLKYAGIPSDALTVVPDPRRALSLAEAAAPADGLVYVLPTYTAMLDLRGRLESEGLVAPFWEELD